MSPGNKSSDSGLRLAFDEAFQRVMVPESSSQVGLERRSFPDQIVFRLMEAVRQRLTEVSEGERWLSQDILIPVTEARGKKEPIRVPALAAMTLKASADHLLRRSLSADAGESVQEYVQNDVPAAARRAGIALGDRQSLPNLVRDDATWGGVIRAYAQQGISQEARHQLEHGISPNLRNSEGEFLVHFSSGSVPSRVHALSSGILRRMDELTGEERQQLQEQMRHWRQWSPYVEKMTEGDMHDVERVYGDVMIPTSRLLDLVSPLPGVRQAALDEVEQAGGFLHGFDADATREMLEKGVVSVLRKTGSAEGYYGVLTEPHAVAAHLRQECGFDPAKTYRQEEDLPTRVQWMNKQLALQMLQNAHRLSFSVEVAVRDRQAPGAVSPRKSGAATALKYDVYNQIPREQPYILLKYFELVEVDGKPVPSAVNFGSRRFIETLGGRQLGVAEETMVRRHETEGREIPIRLLWHLWLSSVDDSRKRMEQLK